MSITETYREQLKEVAIGVDTSIHLLLNICTVHQLNEVVEQHKHIKWDSPIINTKMVLDGICKKGDNWYMLFQFLNSKFETGSYLAHDLNIQDVLGLMATCENVLLHETVLTHEAV